MSSATKRLCYVFLLENTTMPIFYDMKWMITINYYRLGAACFSIF